MAEAAANAKTRTRTTLAIFSQVLDFAYAHPEPGIDFNKSTRYLCLCRAKIAAITRTRQMVSMGNSIYIERPGGGDFFSVAFHSAGPLLDGAGPEAWAISLHLRRKFHPRLRHPFFPVNALALKLNAKMGFILYFNIL